MLCALLAAAGSGGNWKSELLSVLALAESACADGEAAQAKQTATANTVARRGLCIVRFPVDVVKRRKTIRPRLVSAADPASVRFLSGRVDARGIGSRAAHPAPGFREAISPV